MAKRVKDSKKKKIVKKELKEEVLDDIKEETIDEELIDEEKNKEPKKKVKFNKKRCIILGSIICVIICVIVGVILYKQGVHEYPIIYKGKDNNLYLLKDGDKPSEAVSFSNRDGIGYISFFNENPRYFLYRKSVDLYIYDVKKNKDKKIISNYSASFVTNDDKYVVAIDTTGTIFSYKLNGDIKEIGENVSGDVAFTNDNILYEDGTDDLYLSFLNGKKDNVVITNKVKSYQFSKDGSKVVYINNDDELIVYTIKNEKSTTINSDVKEFYCDSDECDDIYYVMKNGDENSILYYNGSKSSVYVKDANALEAVDVDANILLYTVVEEGNYVLYIKIGKSDSELIDKEYGRSGYARINDAKEVYYVKGNKDLNYYNIKKGNNSLLISDVSGGFIQCNDGFYIFSGVDVVGSGVLYYLEGNKATKVNDSVYSFNYYFINKKGDRIYYLTNYGNKVGTLYMYDGKENTLISDSVYQYQYINDDLVYYLRDYDIVNLHGTLYKYSNKKKEVITDRVQGLVQFRVNEYRK